MSKAEVAQKSRDDVWIPSACGLCYSRCAIRVHRVDGVVVKIEGNPDSPTVQGRICSRGLSGIMRLYDPKRLNVPLKRTNPEKGIGIDPRWVEITWEEALETIAERLKRARAEDPRKLLSTGSVMALDLLFMNQAFATAFGTPNSWVTGAGTHCGNADHLMSGILHGSWVVAPDPDHCRYILNFGGVPVGAGAYYAVNAMAQRLADRRVNGMRQVVIDPWMGMAAEKADEWIPIRPGTDAAMALAMLNEILNELGMYDADYLKHHTNGPYLVGGDSHYVRDPASQKPLVWDSAEGRAKTFDDETVKDFALEGEYRVAGAQARPAFALLKEHVRRYTPEMAATVTTVPAETIRRLAREFAEAAMIGSTVVLEGKTLPYRPVAVSYFRGAHSHRHATLEAMAFELLAEVVGASNVPGATLGWSTCSQGFPETGAPAYGPSSDRDGLLIPGTWVAGFPPYPLRPACKPETIHFQDFVPTASVASPLIPFGLLEPEAYGIPYKVDVHIQNGTNFLVTVADPNLVAKAFRDVFTVNFNLYLDESSDLADIMLPDASHLERLDLSADWMASFSPTQTWTYGLAQPVVPPAHQRRASQEVLLELADRIGILGDVYSMINLMHGFRAPYTLDPKSKYTWEEIVDRRYKSLFGPQHGLEWFKQNGVLTWPKKVEEVYWKPFTKVRVPVYFEFIKTAGEDIEKVKRESGIEALKAFDTADFRPLPDWQPCLSYEAKRRDFDLYCVYYRVPFHSFTSTQNNPWLDEISQVDPFVNNIAMNAETARKKGFKDGDWIELESEYTAGKVTGRVKLSQCIHPEVVAVCSGGGHWAPELPIATQPGKGVSIAWLLPLAFDHLDTVSFTQDLCIKVKASAAQQAQQRAA